MMENSKVRINNNNSIIIEEVKAMNILTETRESLNQIIWVS